MKPIPGTLNALVSVSPGFEVVIPQEIREALDLLPGDCFEVRCHSDRLELILIPRAEEADEIHAYDLAKASMEEAIPFEQATREIERREVVAFSPGKRRKEGEGSNLIVRARDLRQRMTDAERLLWSRLRRRFLGIKFRRQIPIGPFIADFVCPARKLVVEVDGGQHLDNAYDEARDCWLRENGYRVLRFWNNEVLGNLEGVLMRIAEEIERPEGPLPDPPPR